MSNQTSLSVEYTANASFAQSVNQAVLDVKRRPHEMGAVPRGEEDSAAKLAVVLDTLAERLEQPNAAPALTEDTPLIPDEVVDWLLREYDNQRDWFVQDVRDTAEALRREQPLTDKQLGILDSLCDAADEAASATFRSLWKR